MSSEAIAVVKTTLEKGTKTRVENRMVYKLARRQERKLSSCRDEIACKWRDDQIMTFDFLKACGTLDDLSLRRSRPNARHSPSEDKSTVNGRDILAMTGVAIFGNEDV